jgi:hypothetical protein
MRLGVALWVVLGACHGDPVEGGSASGVRTPLPSEVSRVVEPACLSCHGDPPTSSAPQSLASVESWRAPSQSEPSKTNGQLAVERMADGLRPMPPTGRVRQDELDVVSEWVARGMPAGNPNQP